MVNVRNTPGYHTVQKPFGSTNPKMPIRNYQEGIMSGDVIMYMRAGCVSAPVMQEIETQTGCVSTPFAKTAHTP